MKRFISLTLILVGFLIYSPSEAAILRNLKLGDRGEDVRELQKILNKFSDTRIAMIGPGSAGNETTYFGVLTKFAVIKFQEKYADQILNPAGLTKGTGFVGAQTRLFLLQLESGYIPVASNQSPVTGTPTALPPKIISISPNIITGSTRELIIVGENFTETENVVLVSSEAPNAFINLPSDDGKTIKFNFHFSSADALKKQFAPIIASGKFTAASASFTKNIQERTSQTGNAQIPVQVAVRNSNGESERVQLLIDITAILKEIGPTTQ
ncbi:MAG: hypothetical protein G01um101419_670 [Parcubacteria group bacterium Gr01-1014_19]|nr:MAG: hypothetical protein G01um101419_670 [Parcubacteria group bacterium Gr01-1014_19]